MSESVWYILPFPLANGDAHRPPSESVPSSASNDKRYSISPSQSETRNELYTILLKGPVRRTEQRASFYTIAPSKEKFENLKSGEIQDFKPTSLQPDDRNVDRTWLSLKLVCHQIRHEAVPYY